MKIRNGLMVAALVSISAQAAEKIPVAPSAVGYVYAADAFVPTRLPHVRDLDRLITEFDLLDGELLRVRREDFGGDGEPEWLIVSPERGCGSDGCMYALVDGQTSREIGRFSGVLVVLKQRQNGYPVIQTINRQDEGFSSLRTYVFANATYQVEDDVLIGEAARLRLLNSLESRH